VARDGAAQLVIPTARGKVFYKLANGELRRRAGESAVEIILLPSVKTSAMAADAQPTVTAWRWELELQPVSKKDRTKMKPLFTFTAVAGKF
jgi:hypothetical protein